MITDSHMKTNETDDSRWINTTREAEVNIGTFPTAYFPSGINQFFGYINEYIIIYYYVTTLAESHTLTEVSDIGKSCFWQVLLPLTRLQYTPHWGIQFKHVYITQTLKV